MDKRLASPEIHSVSPYIKCISMYHFSDVNVYIKLFLSYCKFSSGYLHEKMKL